METSKAEGKRSFKYSNTEEEEEEEEEVEEEEDEDDGGLGFRELDGKKKREITSSSRKPSGSGGSSPPTCQVENCNADLTGAKHYHRRHKVCEFHAKAAFVHVAGGQKRFCQQCSRFHDLSEFDEYKRSCRKRLAGHNERRRKSSSDFPREGSN